MTKQTYSMRSDESGTINSIMVPDYQRGEEGAHGKGERTGNGMGKRREVAKVSSLVYIFS